MKGYLKNLGRFSIGVFGVIFVVRLTWLLIRNTSEFNSVINEISLPISLICLSLIFRKPIEKLISNISRIKFGDKQIDINEVREISKETNEIILKSIEPEVESNAIGGNISKQEAENLMEFSAAWGYQMANIGFKTTPKPVIKWVGKIPEIAFGVGSGQNQMEEKFYLIREISETQSELDKIGPLDKLQSGLAVSKEIALNKKLKRLQNLLGEIDPGSVFTK